MTIGAANRGSLWRRRFPRRVVLLVVCGLLLASAGLSAPATAQTAAPAVTSVGTLTLLWALPHGTGTGAPIVKLTTDAGEVFDLEIAEEASVAAGGLLKLDRRRVQVTGTVRSASAGAGDRPVLQATAIQAVAGPSPSPEPITGQQRFVSILCRFADSTSVTPNPASYFTELLGATYPGINHFWRENSFGLINNDGSSVVGWLNLPNPRSYYVSNNSGRPGISFERLAGDCTAAADASVNFNDFLGINLMFNELLDCCAWGGSTVLTRDGTTKAWPATWMPPWGYQNQDVLGHEMGHAYGLPHSGGQYNDAYDSQWDVMSNGGTCNPRHSTFGCLGVHTIGYHKDLLGWIPAARKYNAAPESNQTIYLEDLAAPPVSGGYQLAKVPIGTSTTNFYTVEARKLVGYDQQVPGAAVVIHEVNTSRERPAQVVDPDNNGNPNDASAMWTPGETFVENGVRVNVVSSDANGFQVNIVRGTPDPPPNDNFPGTDVPPPGLGSPRSFDAFTAAATVQPGEPANVCAAATTAPSLKKSPLPAGVSAVSTGKTVWYRFTAPRTSDLTITTAGSGFDTVLAVFTGAAVNSLTPVPGACNDDSDNTYQSRVVFSATNGTTYYVQAGGYNGAAGDLAIEFSGDFVPRPANDDFPGAEVLPWSASAPHSFTVNTEAASSQSGEPANVCSASASASAASPGKKPAGADPVPTSKTVWYRFTAPGGAQITIDTATSTYDTVLAVFTGGAVNSLTPVTGACNDDFNGSLSAAVTFTPASGTTYYVQVGGYSGSSGNLAIQFNAGTPPPAPANDNFPGTTVTPPLANAPRSFTVGTNGATTQSGEPGNVCTSGSPSAMKPAPAPGPEAVPTSKTVWYRFLAPASGELTIDTAGSSFDTVLAVFTGGAVNSLTAVPGACNDDSNSTYQSRVIFTPVGGTTYYVQVGGYSGASGNLSIQFRGNFSGKSAVSDFNGDGKTDFGIYRPSNGGWYVALTGGGATSASWGASGDVPVAGDYNGDGKADFGIYRPSNGGWFVALTGGGSASATWGVSGDVPAPGDYNGDGKTDFGIFRPSNGGWYVALAGGGSTSASWGTTGDVPVPGDYNGDGKTDFGIFRPANGGWYVAFAGGGATSASWGTTGDVPVPGDYNGDGKTDFGIFRPANGGWYVALAGGGATSATWGASGDVPAPGDYNGDGKTDFGIFRPANGGWYVALAGGGATSATWGTTGDIPLPLPYAVWKRFYGPA